MEEEIISKKKRKFTTFFKYAMNAHISKPIEIPVLIKTISEVLEKNQ